MTRHDKKKTVAVHAPAKADGWPAAQPLRHFAAQAFRSYLKELNGNRPKDLYRFVLGEIEAPLIQVALEYTEGNQTEAARLLGLSRATLRKKLRLHGVPTPPAS
ncbi:DNA-binding protein Fis [mine drainage metagenome]|uniref:Putative Fis-like DNA-binding protein n=1 Tax=mine drainage metagenome TaxID=410659 RepID=T1ATS6_9ZZZZ